MLVLARTALAALIGLGALAVALVAPESRAQATHDQAMLRLSAAAAIQSGTRARLGVLGDAFTCPDARFVAYRRSDVEPEFADQWYVASQLWADALLVATATADPGAAPTQSSLPAADPGAAPTQSSLPADWNPDDARCYVDKGFVFLDRLWDFTSSGYFPRSNPVGTSVDNSVRFTDDNLIAGLALLETARTTPDPLAIRRYIHAAQREADFLEDGGLWDTTFGGGFWWNTGRGDSQEGKPAQTNALAGLFFARLYNATGDATYRDRSLRSLLWLDTILYDAGRHLYRWSVRYADIPHRSGAVVNTRYFNYDQGIAIEAEVQASALDGDANRLSRAQDVARALHPAFWSDALASYNLESGVDQVFTSYAAWTSLGYLALYGHDGDPAWLDQARSDANALEAHLREADGGYAYRSYRCVDRVAKGCDSGQASQVIDHTRDTSAQAWMQHLETALAQRFAAE